MLAIVEIGGKQYTAKVGDKIVVDRQQADIDGSMNVQALLTTGEDGSGLSVGTAAKSVSLKVLSHTLGDKLRVFKMKSKKRYARTRGFRAHLSTLEVTAIA